MNFQAYLEQRLFTIGQQDFSLGQIISAVVVLVIGFFLYRLLIYSLLPRYFQRERIKTTNHRRVVRSIRFIFYLLTLIGVIWCLQLDYVIYETERFDFRISTLLEALMILLLAQLLDWIISKFLLYNYFLSRDQLGKEHKPSEETKTQRASRVVQYAVYALAAILLVRTFNLDYVIYSNEEFTFRISSIFNACLILLLAQLIIWTLTQVILFSYYKRNSVDKGSQYAVNQLLRYIVYVLATLFVLDSVGVQMTVVWGGAAALLLGVGLGLQQTFNDFISGLILLFERTVEVGDVVEVGGLIGTVRKIGLRTSLVETRANISVIVPNSQFTIEKVVNWSHSDDKIRFHLSIGVAYGSDTQLVKKLLLEVAKENVYALDTPSPLVRFIGFGDSSLDFELHFWSRNYNIIEDIKSDIRFEIDRSFRKNQVEIPFPQRDVWIRKNE